MDLEAAVIMNKSCPPGFHEVKLESVDHALLFHAKQTKGATKTVIATEGENAATTASVKETL